jgi:hypothetical protein
MDLGTYTENLSHIRNYSLEDYNIQNNPFY